MRRRAGRGAPGPGWGRAGGAAAPPGAPGGRRGPRAPGFGFAPRPAGGPCLDFPAARKQLPALAPGVPGVGRGGRRRAGRGVTRGSLGGARGVPVGGAAVVAGGKGGVERGASGSAEEPLGLGSSC